MSTNKTENYGLHDWVAGDDFLREEMNENFAQVDRVVSKKLEAAQGAYTGSEAMVNNSWNSPWQVVELGFTPRLVIVCMPIANMYNAAPSWSSYCLFPGETVKVQVGTSYYGKGEILEGSFQVNGVMNLLGTRFVYLAFQ